MVRVVRLQINSEHELLEERGMTQGIGKSKHIKALIVVYAAVMASCSMPSTVVPYNYSYPLISSHGCPPIAGQYELHITPSRTGHLEDFLQQDFAAGLMASVDDSDKKLQLYLQGLKNPEVIVLAIDGDPNSQIDISLLSGDRTIVIDHIRLTVADGQYVCGSGILSLNKIKKSGHEHEVGPYWASSQRSISSATDGSLAAHFVSSSQSFVWAVFPTNQSTDTWVIMRRIERQK
jgi:hypothetical protein